MRAPRGQNFLYQPAWQRRAVEAANFRPEDWVLEIGRGEGGVSALLAERAARLTVVEIDPVLAAGLRRRFEGQPAVEVVEADFLEVDVAAMAAERGIFQWRVFGNLPYYITSPILLELFHRAEVVRDATVMVQKEVADRMLAAPGRRTFGLLSATTQLHSRPRRLFDLPPGAFRPAPKVDSTLLYLDFAPQALTLGVDAWEFEGFLRLAFSGKRKMLAGVLRQRFPAAAIAEAMAAAETAKTARAEELELSALATIWRRLQSR